MGHLQGFRIGANRLQIGQGFQIRAKRYKIGKNRLQIGQGFQIRAKRYQIGEQIQGKRNFKSGQGLQVGAELLLEIEI